MRLVGSRLGKEKFEDDLKEIKKLQIYRKRNNSWMQSSEITDMKVGFEISQLECISYDVIEANGFGLSGFLPFAYYWL